MFDIQEELIDMSPPDVGFTGVGQTAYRPRGGCNGRDWYKNPVSIGAILKCRVWYSNPATYTSLGGS